MEKKFVSAVAYLHNDELCITNFLEVMVRNLKADFEHFELILVDDASVDTTMAKVHEYVEKNDLEGMVSVVHMGIYQGLEPSMNAGRDVAIGDFVYEFDDIGIDYDESLIRKLYDELLKGYDIVSASPNGKISLTSKMFYRFFNKFSYSVNDILPETFRIVSRRAINRIKSMGTHIPYRKAVYANCGLSMTSIKYDMVSKNNSSRAHKGMTPERRELALDSFIYFTNLLEKISSVLSVGFLTFFLVSIVYVITDYILSESLASGWPSLMMFISLGFFGIFTMLTMILKYLSVILNLIFRQQKYLVSGVEKF